MPRCVDCRNIRPSRSKPPTPNGAVCAHPAHAATPIEDYEAPRECPDYNPRPDLTVED